MSTFDSVLLEQLENFDSFDRVLNGFAAQKLDQNLKSFINTHEEHVIVLVTGFYEFAFRKIFLGL